MARNIKYEEGNQLVVAPTAAIGARVASGDPVVLGQLPGVALVDGSDTVANRGTATVKFDGVALLTVYGHDGTSNTAVAAGDIVYFDAGTVNVRRAAVRYGYALDPVTSGSRTAIRVKIGY